MRPGLALYGLPPVQAVRDRIDLQPVMTFKTRLMQLKRVPAGTGVGYGHDFRCARPSVIALVPIGYADGLQRCLGNGRGTALVRGEAVPIVGRDGKNHGLLQVSDKYNDADFTADDEVHLTQLAQLTALTLDALAAQYGVAS